MKQSSKSGVNDRREVKRKKVAIPATVYDENGSNPIRCVVRDASKAGCMIVSSRTVDLTEHVLIEVTNFKGARKGRVVRRDSMTAGVMFV